MHIAYMQYESIVNYFDDSACIIKDKMYHIRIQTPNITHQERTRPQMMELMRLLAAIIIISRMRPTYLHIWYMPLPWHFLKYSTVQHSSHFDLK